MFLCTLYKAIVKFPLPSRLTPIIGTRIFHADTFNINSIRRGLCHPMALYSSVWHSVYMLFSLLYSLAQRRTAVRFRTQSLCINCHVFCPLSQRNGLFGQPSFPVSSWPEIFRYKTLVTQVWFLLIFVQNIAHLNYDGSSFASLNYLFHLEHFISSSTNS